MDILIVDRNVVNEIVAQELNRVALRFQERASQRVDTTLTYADAENPNAVVHSDDPNWSVLEYGTVDREPDPWAVTTLMNLNG